jgi:hypothetical protein
VKFPEYKVDFKCSPFYENFKGITVKELENFQHDNDNDTHTCSLGDLINRSIELSKDFINWDSVFSMIYKEFKSSSRRLSKSIRDQNEIYNPLRENSQSQFNEFED